MIFICSLTPCVLSLWELQGLSSAGGLIVLCLIPIPRSRTSLADLQWKQKKAFEEHLASVRQQIEVRGRMGVHTSGIIEVRGWGFVLYH